MRSLHFACTSAFGDKLPVFSAEQLALCKEKTVLFLKNLNENDNQEKDIYMILNSVDDDGNLNISLQVDGKEVSILSEDDLFNFNEGRYNVYYLLDSEEHRKFISDDFKQKVSKAQKKGARKVIKKGINLGMAPHVAKVVGKSAAGPLLHVALGSAEAGIATYQSKQKEKEYKESEGLKGFSNAQAKKEITSKWGKAAAGTAGGVASAALLASSGAVVGQVNIVTSKQQP